MGVKVRAADWGRRRFRKTILGVLLGSDKPTHGSDNSQRQAQRSHTCNSIVTLRVSPSEAGCVVAHSRSHVPWVSTCVQ
jgi:hypothetical protein